jgi:hypothetical protein
MEEYHGYRADLDELQRLLFYFGQQISDFPRTRGRNEPAVAPTRPQLQPGTQAAAHSPDATASEQGQPPAFVPTPPDITILAVLPSSGEALTCAGIVQGAARALREKHKAREESRLISLSETVLAGRIPLLLDAGLVARPVGPNGKPTNRKGVGITAKGRELLAKAAG